MMTYYMIPLASVSKASGQVWYATWSKARPTATWSDVMPAIEPDDQTTWVVAVVRAEQCPEGAIALGTGGKQEPPPPLQISADDLGISGFQKSFARWQAQRSL